MSDLNTAFVDDAINTTLHTATDNLAVGLTENLGTGVDDTKSVEATVQCSNLHEQNLIVTTYSGSNPDLHRETNVRECVWETCYTVPVKLVGSNVPRKKQHRNKGHEPELESNRRLKSQSRMKQKNDATSKSKRKANNKRKKSKLSSPEKANLGHGKDSCLLVEKASLQAWDADGPSAVSRDAYDVTVCVEKVAEHMTELPAAFGCVEDESKSPCNDSVAHMLETAPQAISVCRDLVDLPDKNTLVENSDENKNVVFEKDCHKEVELLKYTPTLNCCDVGASNIQCMMDSAVESTVTECVPSSVDESIFTCEQQQQQKVKLKKAGRRRSQRIERINARLYTDLDQASEKLICNKLDSFSAIEECEGCAEITAGQDANIAGPEDPVAGFVDDTLNTVTAQCLPCVTADVQISGQCLAEDDLDDIAEFPIFTKRSSQRLRRTSIEIYRKSLHDAENIADEEECETASVFFDSAETTADHVEMNSTNDGILGDELASLCSESNQSVMLRTIEVENVNTQSDVQTAQLPSIANSDSVVKSETDSTFTNITNNRRQRRNAGNVSRGSRNLKTRQCTPSASVEDIYLNRLWRSQMPKEKALESIPELPTSEQRSAKVTKRVRCLKFADDPPNRTKLRQRRQKAVKNGWKPLTKKQNALLESQLSDKLAEMDCYSV